MSDHAIFFDPARGVLLLPQEVIAGLRSLGAHEAAAAYELSVKLAKAYGAAGGRALMVGGSVRDLVLGQVFADIDLEVYGLPAEDVEFVAQTFGEVSDVGKAFAILKLVVNGIDIDIAVPRQETKTGNGHKGFTVLTDPKLDPREAARRRDFTINAIAADPLTGEIIDPYGGLEDLAACALRVVDPATFVEDPLRVLRALQLAARFNCSVDEASLVLLQTMAPRLQELAPERIGGEWRKLLLKAEAPSTGLRLGMETGAFAVLHPELVALGATPQEPEWHPEGDVWVHTMMVVDEAAKIVRREALGDERALTVLLGALCHDMGKPFVTCMEEGRIRSHGHEEAGVVPTREFLKTLHIDHETIEKVVGVVRDHMKPFRLWASEVEKATPISDGAIRRLAARIDPSTIAELVLVTEADFRGRGPFSVAGRPGEFAFPGEYKAGEWLCERADKLGVMHTAPEHLLRGGEVIDLGYAPGPMIGQIIRLADELRDEKEVSHYKIVSLLKDVSVDSIGNRDAESAIARLTSELG